MMACCQLFAIFVCYLIIGLHGTDAGFDDFFGSSSNKPRNCRFTQWGRWTSCKMNSRGKFEHTRKREMFQPRFNGKACPRYPVLTQKGGCTEIQVMADKLLASLHASKPGLDTRQFRHYRPSLHLQSFKGTTNMCREWRDSKGNIIMGGGQCSSKRVGKRSTSSDYGRAERVKRDAINNLDILFLLDESGSVRKTNFENIILYLAQAITSTFCDDRAVNRDKTRISVASFDKENHAQFFLNNDGWNDKGKVIEKIRQIRYNSRTDGRTCLGDALKFAKDTMFNKVHGARLERETEQLIILITDGCANCNTNSLTSISKSLYDADIALYALFINRDDDCTNTLLKLENKLEDKCWGIYSPGSWDKAKELADEIIRRGCSDVVEGWANCY